MDIINIIGLIAGCFTTIAFFPQVIKTWKTRSADDLSLGMFSIFSTGVALWVAYGIMVAAWPIIISNSIILLACLLLLYFKFSFGNGR